MHHTRLNPKVSVSIVFVAAMFMTGAAGYLYLSSRGKAAPTGTSQVLEQMLY